MQIEQTHETFMLYDFCYGIMQSNLANEYVALHYLGIKWQWIILRFVDTFLL